MVVKKKENVNMSKKQFIGLDIGTDSVGWAVTNEKYEVVKAKGKLLYGTRIFSSANDASERRAFRANRRRMNRRKERTALLESLFSEPISAVDFEFFQRLKESAYYDGDKTVKGDFSLFNDPNYTDRDYYKQYPTIYHLRKEMIEKDKKFDVRLLYLAVHHLIKYRGNFLLEGQKISNEGQKDNKYLVDRFKEIIQYYENNEVPLDLFIDDNNAQDFVDTVIRERGITKTKTSLISLCQVNDKLSKAILNAIAGGKVNIASFLPMLEIEGVDPATVQFNKADFEDNILPSLKTQLGDDSLVIEKLYRIYSWLQYKKILNGYEYYSFAMVDRYDAYKQDLKDLKALYRKYLSRESYNQMFRIANNKIKNYAAYNKGTQYKGKKHYVKSANYDDFIKFLKKDLLANEKILSVKKVAEDGTVQYVPCEEYQHILDRISSNDFLKKIVNSDNGVLPYQLNELELRKILENQKKYHPFLNVREDGLSVAEKIVKLLTFRVPYYVGPLNNYHSKLENKGFSWVVRKKKGKVTPWNFDSLVDRDESENRFITTMTNKCTYLRSEDVLPKQSLLYQEYMVLNELNNIKLNNERLDVKLKQRIFNELFCKQKKVTIKKLKRWLKENNIVSSESGELTITGLADDFKSSLSSYVEFSKIIGDFDMNNCEMVEKIIRWIVISPDIGRIKRRISNDYKDHLTEDQIEQISHLSFSGWGRFSKKLLNSDEVSYLDPASNQKLSVVDLLYSTKLNFMEILFSDQFGISKAIANLNQSSSDVHRGITYEDVDNLPVSPIVKRPVNQSIKIVNEIKKITKKDPDKIFVEVIRQPSKNIKKEVPNSRKERLLEAYRNLGDDCQEYDKLIRELTEKEGARLRQDKLYLYFSQLGKDMYTGESIHLEELSSEKYDIDHIFPQSIIKDDSLSNRVLVNKQSNARKGNAYPISSEIRMKMIGTWKMLRDKKLISKLKYERLTRSTKITDGELNSFVSRQIVATSQATNAVINLLKQAYPNSTIVWSKASHVSNFRVKYDLLKSREANDYHHAKDAYLNIVVGNVYDVNYRKALADKAWLRYINSENPKELFDYFKRNSLTSEHLFQRNIAGAWSVDKESRSIDIVKKYMKYNSVLFTVMPTENRGAFYDQNPLPKGPSNALIPIKSRGPISNTKKYGGYNKPSTAYFFMVESLDKKGKKIVSIESMPVMFAERYERDENFAYKLMTGYFKLVEPKILVKKILINSLIKIGKTPCRIASKSGDSLMIAHNIQWNVDQNTINYLHLLEKYRSRQVEKKQFDFKHPLDKNINKFELNGLPISTESKLKLQVLSKEKNLQIYQKIQHQLSKEIYSGLSSLKKLRGIIGNGIEKFVELDIKSQVIVLFELINILKSNRTESDLLIIGGSKHNGNLKISKKVSKDKEIRIINQSVTGVYEKVEYITGKEN